MSNRGISVRTWLEPDADLGVDADTAQPLFSCIHSIQLSTSAQFPIMSLVQMFHNLRLLQLWGKPRWYVIKGGS